MLSGKTSSRFLPKSSRNGRDCKNGRNPGDLLRSGEAGDPAQPERRLCLGGYNLLFLHASRTVRGQISIQRGHPASHMSILFGLLLRLSLPEALSAGEVDSSISAKSRLLCQESVLYS